MRVLSLYDGMSCGMLAFMRAGIPVESYDAFEIDKHAVKVSQHNFPQIVQHGDVFKGDFASYRGKVDAVVGGSPCFVAGTMVLTSDGMKPIEQVRIGDLVFTHCHRFRPVTAVGHKTAPAFRLSSDGIPDIILTENHPFYVSRMTVGRYGARSYSEPCWKAVGELVPDRDFLSSPIMAGSLNPRGLTVDHCRLLAMMLTDRHTPDRYGLWADDVASENHVRLDRTAPLTQLVSENSVPYHPDFREIPVEVLQLPQDLAHAFLGCFLDLVAKHDAENDVWTYRAKNRAMAYSLALLAQKVYGTPGLVSEETIYRGCDDGSVAPTTVWAVTMGYGTSRMVSGRRIGNDLFTRFASLEPCGEAKVYNLSVEQDESYLADDRIVHNCTYWSIAQSKNRETEAHGIGWELFQQYVRAVREAEPVRVGIMPRSDGEVFDRQGTRIYDPDGKSITLSGDGGGAKEKMGLYAIPVEDPKGFSMTGTFGERHAPVNDKAYCLAANPSSDMSARVIEPVSEEIPLNSSDGKSRTLMAGYGKYGMQTLIAQKGWNGGTTAVAEPIPVNTIDGKSKCIRASCEKDGIRNLVGNDKDRRTCVAEPFGTLSEEYYKGGFDGELVGMVETEASYRNGEQPSQQYRVYHCDSKSKCLDQDQRRFYLTPDEVGKGQPVYTVEGGRIAINGKSYPIKLKDGRYIIRKLSVDECKRLQTVPDWYDMSCISKSQAYKCLGNGWTIDVIAHLIEGAVRELDPDFVPKEVKAGPVAKVATLDSFTEVSP